MPTSTTRTHDDAQAAHEDMRELISTLRELTMVLQPLAEHVPTLVDVAKAWNTGATIGRTARFAGGLVKWLGSVAIGVAALWAAFHLKYMALLGNQP